MLERAYEVYKELLAVADAVVFSPPVPYVSRMKRLRLAIQARALFAEVNLFVELVNFNNKGTTVNQVTSAAALHVATTNCITLVKLLQSTSFVKEDEFKIIKTFDQKVFEYEFDLQDKGARLDDLPGQQDNG